jgi:hypothetical protein
MLFQQQLARLQQGQSATAHSMRRGLEAAAAKAGAGASSALVAGGGKGGTLLESVEALQAGLRLVLGISCEASIEALY